MKINELTGFEEAQLHYPNWKTEKGFFGILWQDPLFKGQLRQTMYHLSNLKTVIEELPDDRTYYITQCTFSTINRKAQNVLKINSCFVDLDIYNADQMIIGRNPDPSIRKEALLQFCDDNLIPKPNLVISSGRGLYVKWLFENAIPKKAISRWKKMEEELVKKFKDWGADPKAKDSSRVFRVVGSVNQKSGKKVKVLHFDERRYPFDDLANEIFPFSRSEVSLFKEKIKQEKKQRRKNKRERLKSEKQKKIKKGNSLNLRTLNYERYKDIVKLAKIRGGFKEGERMTTLMWMLNFLAGSGDINAQTVITKAREIVDDFFPDFDLNESDLSTLVEKVAAFNRGKKIYFMGKVYPPLYTPKNETLMQILAMTDSEIEQMKTIISKEEKALRDKSRKEKKRRANGQKTRAEYEANSENRSQPWVELGIGKTTYYKRKKAGTLPIPIRFRSDKNACKSEATETEIPKYLTAFN